MIRATLVQRSSVLKNQSAKIHTEIKEQESSRELLQVGNPNRRSRQTLSSRQSLGKGYESKLITNLSSTNNGLLYSS